MVPTSGRGASHPLLSVKSILATISLGRILFVVPLGLVERTFGSSDGTLKIL
jgi:hypothetical protein